VGVGVPKGGIGHTGHIVSAPFARENPPPRPVATAPRKAGGSGGVPGWPVGLLGQWVASQSGSGEASRPKVSLSPGVGSGGVGGQRLHLAKSVLGPLRWPVGGVGAGRRRPLPSLLASGWPVGGQWVASEGRPSLLWPVRGRLPP